MDLPADDQIEQWTSLLRKNWEELAHTRFRDYFIASHRGWDAPEVWTEQARYDAEVVLHELSPAAIAALDVLELGCGVGRLAQVLAPRVRSYTGFDIAPAMVAEARQRGAGLANARFLVGAGDRVPDAARDHRYTLAFALAVFVHCPRELIGLLVADVCSLLAPGGEFRCQLRADVRDPTGIAPMSEVPLTVAPPSPPSGPLEPHVAQDLEQVEALLSQRYYMGHAFGYDEARDFLQQVVPRAVVRVMRFDPQHLYVDVRVH